MRRLPLGFDLYHPRTWVTSTVYKETRTIGLQRSTAIKTIASRRTVITRAKSAMFQHTVVATVLMSVQMRSMNWRCTWNDIVFDPQRHFQQATNTTIAIVLLQVTRMFRPHRTHVIQLRKRLWCILDTVLRETRAGIDAFPTIACRKSQRFCFHPIPNQ